MVRMEYRWTSLRSWMLAATLLAAVFAGGCAEIGYKKPKVTITPTKTAAPAPVASSTAEPEAAERLSLPTIVRRYLQNGHYAEGEKALRNYLHEHPGDRSAQFFLRQLTEDPKQALGSAASPHIVQPGESYSTLAAKYLGDSNLFLVLARYNDSANPALIRVGSTLQIPYSRSAAAMTEAPLPANNAAAATSTATNPPSAPAVAPAGPPSQRAQQLESQSLALYRQGRKDQALTLFDQALALNPQLRSSDPDFAALSRVWVANSHQQAMVLYLDQHLDQAIALWNRILVVDPGYEPAVVYRTRALELKQRLQQY
jgi:tetratricopeptide (TPR) repeat protein